MTDTLRSPWVPFFLDTNAVSIEVQSRRDWEEKVLPSFEYMGGEQWLLDTVKEYEGASGGYDFGLRIEHKGPKTLREFFEEQGMTPSYELTQVRPNPAPSP